MAKKIVRKTEQTHEVGQAFGTGDEYRWQVKDPTPVKSKHGIYQLLVHCQCSRNTVRLVSIFSLRSGKSKNCGCVRKERMSTHPIGFKHGQSIDGKRTPEYQSWQSMIQRCTDPKSISYPRYGERGILPCQGFREAAHFFNTLGPKPTRRHSLERIDNEKGYTCGACNECRTHGWELNCCWALPTEQARNRCDNHWIEFRGERLCITDWARRLNTTFAVVYDRIFTLGWDLERALTTPGGTNQHRPTLTYNGQTMTLTGWAKQLGITRDCLYRRLYRFGWSPEKALTSPQDQH